VQVVKTAISGSQSDEIFPVCQGYRAPTNIDPRTLDPKCNSYKYRPLAGVPCISADGQTVDIFMRYSLLNAKKILVFP